jgi:hypothetical protein
MPALPQSITGNPLDMLADNVLQWLSTDWPPIPHCRAPTAPGRKGDLAHAMGTQEDAGFPGLGWRDLSPDYLERLQQAIERCLATDPALRSEEHFVDDSERPGLHDFLEQVRAHRATDEACRLELAISASSGAARLPLLNRRTELARARLLRITGETI